MEENNNQAIEITVGEVMKLEEQSRAAARENMRRSYEFRNDGLRIKYETMNLLYQQVELLAEKAQRCEGDEQLRIIKVMAMLGQAIIPD